MITEQDLQEAIAECKGQRNPTANTCIKLAAFYTIKEHLYPEQKEADPDVGYSYRSSPQYSAATVETDAETEFAQIVNGRGIDEVMAVVIEAMDALKVLNPRFYASILRKFEA